MVSLSCAGGEEMFLERFSQLQETLALCSYSSGERELSAQAALEMAHRFLEKINKDEGVAYVIGNGGSAGIASHFSNDLVKTLGIRSQTLYDSNLLTCFSNDYGYEEVFSGPLKVLARHNDLLFAISSSGKSPNILAAVQTAKKKSIPVVTFTGFDARNPLRSMGDLNFYLPKNDYGLVEGIHFFLLHTLIDLWKHPSKTQAKK